MKTQIMINMKKGRFNPTRWENMLKERKSLTENGTQFSMSNLLAAHGIASKWCKYINPAVAHFQQQKNRPLVTPEEYFLYVKALYERDHESQQVEETPVEVPVEVEVPVLDLSTISLEDLISEINRRGFKVYQQ